MGVFVVALGAFAIIGIAEERRQVRDLEAAQGEALLRHLAGMPELRVDSETANAHLAALLPSLRKAGGEVRLVPLGVETAVNAGSELLARWPLTLAGQPFELRYEGDGRRLATLMRRTVLIHTVHAGLAVGALLFGLWWILTRHLVSPLREICCTIDRMRSGGGWQVVVPQTDAELSALVLAVSELGPGLEEQVHQWITAERRAAVATALSSLQSGMSASLSRMRAAMAERAAGAIPPDERAHLRSMRADLDRVTEAFAREERYQFGREDRRHRRLGRAEHKRNTPI